MFVRSAMLVDLIFVFCLFSSTVNANDVDDSKKTNSNINASYEQLYHLAYKGSATAQYELGLLFEYGRGVKPDDTLAAYWYEKSAAQFFPEALYRLAVLYDNGWGLPPDKEKALDLYKTAAEKEHQLAQHDLAMMYFQGTGTPRSLLEAYKWIKIAVIGGNPLMQKHLTMIAREMSLDEIEVAEYLARDWVSHSNK